MGGSRKRKGVKRNFNKELETTSKKELLNVLTVDFFQIRFVADDTGVDATVELKGPENHLGTDFVVQLKATRKSKGKGTHSVSVETDNLEYLLSHAQLGIYILYIEEKNAFYYEWAEELAKRLTEKKPAWREQENISIRFQRPLNQEAAKIIYDTVQKEGNVNRRERDFLIGGELKSIINSIHDERKTTILDAFEYLFSTISGIMILPMHVIERLPPFANSHRSASYYSENQTMLYTDNPKLFQFFEQLSKKGNTIVLNSHEEEVFSTKNKSSLLKNILNFFYRHAIHHINLVPGKGVQKRICIHDLYTSGKCDCERCRYYRFDFKGALLTLKKAKPKTAYARLRNAHTHLELGDLKTSFQLYKQLAQAFKRKGEYVAYFMCKYTLSTCQWLFQSYYFESNRNNVLEYIRNINLDDELYLLKKKSLVKDEVILALKWITQGHFVNYGNRQIDERRQEIDYTYENDKLGGSTTADYSDLFLKYFDQLTDFVEFNLIMYEAVPGYSLFVDKAFTGALKLHKLLSENNTRLAGINSSMLGTFLLQGSASKMDHAISRHHVKTLPFGVGARESFIKFIDNLMESLDGVNIYVNIKDKDHANYFLSRKVNDILRNACVLVSVLDLKKEQLTSFTRLLVSAIKEYEFIERSVGGYLVQIINRKYDSLELGLLEEIYVLSLENKKFDHDQIKAGIPQLFRKHFPEHTIESRAVDATLNLLKTDASNLEVDILAGFWDSANNDQKTEIAAAVSTKLEARFDSDDYYIAALRGIIDYRKFLEQCIEGIPRTEREKENQKYFVGKETRNRRLNFLIDLAYKFNLNLKDPAYQALSSGVPYFDWLLNLDSFDYSVFNPMWLLEFHSDWYFAEFKKYPNIKESTRAFLLEQPVEGIMKIYLKHFSD